MYSDMNDARKKYNVIVYGSHQYHTALHGISVALIEALKSMGYVVFFCDCCSGSNDNFVESINLLKSGEWCIGIK